MVAGGTGKVTLTDERLTELNAASNRMRARERVFVDCPNCEMRSFAYLLDKVHPGMTFGQLREQMVADGWSGMGEHAGYLKKCEAHK